MRRLHLVIGLAVVLCICPSACAAARAVLEVAGPAGSRSFTLARLKALPATEGWAGFKSSTGRISLPERYKGVALEDLMAVVGGFDSSKSLSVVARDGYAITLSHDQVTKGTFAAYDPGTGERLESHGPLTAVLAYERDSRPLDAEKDGTLRLVIVGARNHLVTDGHWSVKWVTRLELKPVSEDWTLRLEGALSEEMDRATFESGASPGCHAVTWKDGEGRAWTGIPLWLLIGRVDDALRHDAGAFNDSLALAGYTVDVVAGDGRTASFASARLRRDDDILVACRRDGAPLPDSLFPLRLVGTGLKPAERIGTVRRIVVGLPAAPVPR